MRIYTTVITNKVERYTDVQVFSTPELAEGYTQSYLDKLGDDARTMATHSIEIKYLTLDQVS